MATGSSASSDARNSRQRDGLGALEAGVEEDRADQRFERIGQDRGPRRAAAARLALAQQQVLAQPRRFRQRRPATAWLTRLARRRERSPSGRAGNRR